MTVIELAKITGLSRETIYKLCRKLGRIPTEEEVLNRNKKVGRPRKWESKEDV